MKSMHLFCNAHEFTTVSVSRSCTIERKNSGKIVNSSRLYFTFPKLSILPEEDDGESYLIAAVMGAMAEKRSLYVHGTLSKELLSNLSEYMAAWHSWCPSLYAVIDIDCDQILDNPVSMVSEHNRHRAIAAYSGGIDSAFSVFRHVQGLAGHRSKEIGACVMVHGFDIPLLDETAYQEAFAKSEKTLASLNLPLMPLETNLKQVVHHSWVNWNHLFAAAVTACLQNFKGQFNMGIIGSALNYNDLLLPWGSNPITDPLLSSPSFTVLHDGAAFNRSAKVAALAQWPAGCDALRVCWKGPVKSDNCGRCEKCVRTKLNFQVNGLPVPKTLKGEAAVADIYRVNFAKPELEREWDSILKTARINNINAHWVRAVKWQLWRARMSIRIKGFLSKRLTGHQKARLQNIWTKVAKPLRHG